MKLKDAIIIFEKFIFLIFWMLTGYLAGDSGIGFFFCAFVIYQFLFLLCLSAIKDTITKLVSVRKSNGFHDNAQKVFYFGVFTSIGIGGFFGMILGFGANKLTSILYGYTIPASILSFFGLYFFITSIKGCLAGYAKGLGYGRYVNYANIAEFIVLLILTPILISKMYKYGIKVSNLLKNSLFANLDGAMGAVISQCISLTVATVIIIVLTMMVHSAAPVDSGVRGINNKRTFIKAYLTTTLNNVIDRMGIVLALLTITIIYIKAGAGYQADTRELFTTLGVFAGKYIVVCAAPFILFSEYVYKERRRIHNDYNHDEHKNIRLRAGNLLKNTLYIMVPISLFVIVLSKPISMIFFAGKMSLGATLLRKGGIVILFAAISYSCRALLRAVELDFYAAASVVTGYIGLLIFMITSVAAGLNVNLLVYALIVFYFLQAVVSAFFIYRMLDVYIVDIGIKALKVIIASLCMALALGIVDKFVDLNLITLILLSIGGYAVYFIVIGVLKGASEKELSSLQGTLTYYPTYMLTRFFGDR